MKRIVKLLILFLLIAPLTLSAETISWTPAPTWQDGTSVSAADQAAMTFYLRIWKEGNTAAKTYFGESRNGVATWSDNILVKANQWAATNTVLGWVPLKVGDNVLVTLSAAFKGSDGVERDSLESPGYRWTLPGYVAPAAPTVTLAASPASVNKGSCSTLSWGSVNATGVSLDQGIGTVALTGTKSVCPASTTTYTATATGAGGTKTASATVTVIVPIPGCNPPTGITIK